jgi:hypothetical protein
MTILEIYEKYKIMPNLQLHQLRVAAVAKQICDNLNEPVGSKVVIEACLFHDMGNIIKFDLTHFPESVGPKGLNYWESVKQDFIKKYGPDEHIASLDIAKELGMNQAVLDCIESIDFKHTEATLASNVLEPKICDHADMRVDPHGVVSLHDRLEEGRKRYAKRQRYWLTDEQRGRIEQACYDIEKRIFQNSNIKPSDITNESVAPIIEELKTYKLS